MPFQPDSTTQKPKTLSPADPSLCLRLHLGRRLRLRPRRCRLDREHLSTSLQPSLLCRTPHIPATSTLRHVTLRTCLHHIITPSKTLESRPASWYVIRPDASLEVMLMASRTDTPLIIRPNITRPPATRKRPFLPTITPQTLITPRHPHEHGRPR